MEALKVIVFICLFVGSIYGCVRLAAYGKQKHQMKIIKSLSFLFVVMSGFFLLFASFSYTPIEPRMTDFYVYFGASILFLLLAVYLNIKNSNFIFGSLFTFVQILLTFSVFGVLLLFLFTHFSNRINLNKTI